MRLIRRLAGPMATHRREDGSAMIITLMVMALITALATTLTTVTINNLQSSWRAQQSGSAANAAEAGISQAMSYLRTNGVRDINRCTTPCSTLRWANSADPVTVTVPGVADQKFRVWIEAKAPYPASSTGNYVIHSVGTAGERSYEATPVSTPACQRVRAQGCREVSQEVLVTGSGVPRGIFAHSIYASGTATVTNQSVFSTGCVYGRQAGKLIVAEAMDLFYKIPASVHTSDSITTENKADCGKEGNWIHGDGEANGNASNGKGPKPNCNPIFPFDQDSHGGPFNIERKTGNVISTNDCTLKGNVAKYPNWTKYYGRQDLDGNGTIDVDGSYIRDSASLLKLFDLTDPPLSDTRLDQLRAIARTQGYYSESTTPPAWPDGTYSQSVLFFDLTSATKAQDWKVNLSNIPYYNRKKGQPDDPFCNTKSLVIVVVNGDMSMNGGDLAASVFLTGTAPGRGQVDKANGNVDFIGTVTADEMTLNGTSDLAMDECFLNNPSPALLDFSLREYREVDR